VRFCGVTFTDSHWGLLSGALVSVVLVLALISMRRTPCLALSLHPDNLLHQRVADFPWLAGKVFIENKRRRLITRDLGWAAIALGLRNSPVSYGKEPSCGIGLPATV
jgi:hypothetical protein